MSIETPPSEPIINEQGEEALQNLELALEAKRIPEEERMDYIQRLSDKLNGETDEDMIDTVQGNIMLDVIKRAKEIKLGNTEVDDKEKEKTCAKCGALNPSSANFCGQCGNKY